MIESWAWMEVYQKGRCGAAGEDWVLCLEMEERKTREMKMGQKKGGKVLETISITNVWPWL